MKKILCFGDSNTYGFIPQNGGRYSENIRWSGVLSERLNGKYEILEAGLNNRNCFMENPGGEDYCAVTAINKYKNSCDILIFALGINDLQKTYNPSLEKFKLGLLNSLNKAIYETGAKRIIVLAPAKLSDDVLLGWFNFQFDKNSIEKSSLLPEIYKKCAKDTGAICIDLNEIAAVSNKDGLHFEAKTHITIGNYLADFILNSNF